MKAWFALATLMAAISCSTIKYVPVETVRRDTTYRSVIQRDSVYVRDSVYIRETADTVYLYKYKYLYKYATLRDTMWRERVDTVTVIQPVEAQLTGWQRTRMALGGYAIAAAALLAIWIAVRFFLRR